MAAKRQSIYLSEPLQRLVEAHRAGEEGGLRSVSGLLATVADRYQETGRRHLPRLTRAECGLVLDALNGVWLREPAAVLTSVWAEIADAGRLSGAGARWGVEDVDDLAARIRDLPYAGTVALVDAVERFWARPELAIAELAELEEIIGEGRVREN